MLWYVLERYVHCLLGISHLKGISCDSTNEHVHLTIQELRGIKSILSYLHFLPPNKKNIPELITDPVALIKDVRTLVERHRNDSPVSAVTGRAVFKATQAAQVRSKKASGKRTPGPKPKAKVISSACPKRRRTRCKACVACNNSDCGQCVFCKDMIKFGGTGKSKQSCTQRQCLQPMLPVNALCSSCGKDGWGNVPSETDADTRKAQPSLIMECCICYSLLHPACISSLSPDVNGVVDEDLPNCWECPQCCLEGKNVNYKPRHFKARNKISSIRENSSVKSNSEDNNPVETYS